VPGAPIDLGAGRTARAIAANRDTSCANLDDGSVKCWGDNALGGLGNGAGGAGIFTTAPGATPVNLGAGRKALAVSTGYSTCAILDDHSLKCWGDNSAGALGNGAGGAGVFTNVPGAAVDLGAGRTALAVSTGSGATCAILDDHSLKCWGSNARGQLGNGTSGAGTNVMVPGAPVNLGAGRTALAVATGNGSTCAILDDHSLRCWGGNTFGNLGNGTSGAGADTNLPGAPVNLGAGRTALEVSVQRDHVCAVLDDHSLKCWGYNEYGELGNGARFTNIVTPGAAIGLGAGRTALAVSVGDYHSCTILDDRTARCWGFSNFGQLGNGDTSITSVVAPPSTPVNLGF